MEQDMLAGKLAEVDAQLAGVHAKLQSAAQMESAELDAAIAQTREETAQCAHALAERLRHSRAHQVGEIADAFEEIREIVRRVQTESGAAMRAERRCSSSSRNMRWTLPCRRRAMRCLWRSRPSGMNRGKEVLQNEGSQITEKAPAVLLRHRASDHCAVQSACNAAAEPPQHRGGSRPSRSKRSRSTTMRSITRKRAARPSTARASWTTRA